MKRFFNFTVYKPFKTLFITIVGVIVFSLGISRIYLDNDLLHWFSKKSKIGKLNYYINERFESNNPIIIMFTLDNEVISKENLKYIRDISLKMKEEKGVVNVISLTEIEDIQGKEDEMRVSKLVPEDLENIDYKNLKNYILSKEAYNGSLLSKDGLSTLLIVQPSPDTKADFLAKKLRKLTDSFIKENNLNWQVYYGGTPMLLNSISDLVVKDLRFLIPLVSLVVFMVLFISFRSIKATLLPLITVLLATASAVGVMGYLGLPLTTFGVAIPVVLIAVGNAYGIHFINEYHEKKLSMQTEEALLKVHERTFVPILMSALTTFGGFMSIAVSNDMLSARDFGIISAIGVIFSFLITISFIPALLKIYPKTKGNFGNLNEETEHKLFYEASRFIFKNKKWVVITFLIFGLVATYFITKVQIKVDYMSYFDKKSEPAIVTDRISKIFDGVFELKLYSKGQISANYLRTLQIIEENLRYISGGKTKPASIVNIISSLNEGMTEIPMIPDTDYEIENLWFFIEGNESIKRLVTEDKNETLISLLLPSIESSVRYKIVNEAENLLKKYSSISTKDIKDSKEEILSLLKIMLKNRLIRANLSISETEINDFLTKNIVIDNLKFTNYSSKNKFLNEISQKFINKFSIPEDKLSKNDIKIAFSPLLWDKFIVPGNDVKIFDDYGVAGLMKLFTDVEQTLLRNQLISLFIIIIIVVILNTITFKSILEGIFSLIPILFTLIVNFGIMGLFKINMDFITTTIAAIAVGAGIDYTIHFLSRYTYEVKMGKDYEEAFYHTFSTTGKGIIFNSFSVGLGFAVLNFSGIMPLRSFGMLMFITMIVSALSALTILPALTFYFRKKILKV